jgi:hypothetical protein
MTLGHRFGNHFRMATIHELGLLLSSQVRLSLLLVLGFVTGVLGGEFYCCTCARARTHSSRRLNQADCCVWIGNFYNQLVVALGTQVNDDSFIGMMHIPESPVPAVMTPDILVPGIRMPCHQLLATSGSARTPAT